ncbi:MAG: hypothetical protein LBR18_06470 [Tannerella sp.]|jgi:type III restriction enzyme|nr:hypothetical protein [Tannerella sp.]
MQHKTNVNELINLISLETVVKAFEEAFAVHFAQKYDYSKLDFSASTTLFKPSSDEFVDELSQGLLGDRTADDISIDARHLYDKAVYDSDIERDVLKAARPVEVVVYGKLPKRSIKAPTYTGGTTSPDFVYALSTNSGASVNLHLIVETKSENLRMSDQIALKAQEKLFKQIPGIEIVWRKETTVADFEWHLKELSRE